MSEVRCITKEINTGNEYMVMSLDIYLLRLSTYYRFSKVVGNVVDDDASDRIYEYARLLTK